MQRSWQRRIPNRLRLRRRPKLRKLLLPNLMLLPRFANGFSANSVKLMTAWHLTPPKPKLAALLICPFAMASSVSFVDSEHEFKNRSKAETVRIR